MARAKKLDFTKAKDVRSALSSLAKTISAYSRTYGSDPDASVISEAAVEGLRDSLGGVYRKAVVREGKKIYTKSVRDGDLFDVLFKEKETVSKDGSRSTSFVLNTGKDNIDAFNKTITDITRKAANAKTKMVEDPESGEIKAVRQLTKAENAYLNTPTLTQHKKDISAEISRGDISKDKTMSRPEQVKSIMVERAATQMNADISDIDEAFKTVSQAVEMGEMAGLGDSIWHHGRQATWADIEAVMAAANRL